MKLKTKKILILGIAASILGVSLPGAQAGSDAFEYEVKAAFLVNFAKFVNWPPGLFPDPKSPIQIGILGEDPFGPFLEKTILDQSVDGHKFIIKRSYYAAALKDCHILFISRSEERSLAEIFTRLKGKNILTIGESKNFAKRGGVINLIKKENKIRFEINADAAREAGLKVSSKLLRLAIVIGSANRSGG